MLRHHILPVFVFDGPPEVLKRPANPEVVRRANNLYQRFITERDPYDETIVEQLNASPATYGYFALAHTRDIATAFGVPVIGAPSEAEMFAAALCARGYVRSVVSNDVDTLLFGSPHVSRQLALGRGEIVRATLESTLLHAGLSLSQLRDLAVLVGCDFHSGLRGIGPRKGIVLLRRHSTLERVLKALGLTVAERQSFLEARRVFDEADRLPLDRLSLTPNASLPSRVVRVLAPALGQRAAKAIADESSVLWREFHQEQAALEQWL